MSNVSAAVRVLTERKQKLEIECNNARETFERARAVYRFRRSMGSPISRPRETFERARAVYEKTAVVLLELSDAIARVERAEQPPGDPYR